MALPDEETQVQVSAEAADKFTSYYYQALNSGANLQPFYVNSSSRYTTPADISINGKVVASPDEYRRMVKAQGTGVRYELDILNAHVVNPSVTLGAPETLYDEDKNEKNGRRMTIAVMAIGRIRFGTGKEALQKMFHESFILTPNWDSMVRNPPRGVKEWLVLSQSFRAL
ncbi:hypothetical protein CDD81_7962 [Ophiocordyceps australis]|uniref:NTF2 domain-containing protein n=1 Tax=Ophiocordyceps australis TaxID=1399860 RepID=A0A2C5XGI7_9HYPO|nr:hypothetical protein CDD81_7962 [Ophiocordyceps australis]